MNVGDVVTLVVRLLKTCSMCKQSDFCSSSLSRSFWSWERDQTEPPKLAEDSLCLCSLLKVSTMTPSSAPRPHQTHSWTPPHKLTQLYHCPAQHSHCSLLRKKAHAEKCLCDGPWVYSMTINTLKVKVKIIVLLHTYSPLHTGVVRLVLFSKSRNSW